MNNRYIAILVIIVAIIAGVFFFSYKKDTPVITPAPVDTAPTSTPVVTPVATTTATTTQTPTPKPTVKPTPTPVVTPKPTPAPTPAPAPTTSVKTYTLAEISLHKSQTDCWTAVNGAVYDITAYVPKHPGGVKQIMQVCGKDGTFLFEDQHSGDKKPNAILASYKIGDLAK